jgi:PHD/YefM family antitoxin component YafN of YafNO toxin-antitoxin module
MAPPNLKVPAGDVQRHIGRYQDLALTQPVVITRNGRKRTVLISAEEYVRLKHRDRQVLTLADFTDADIAALEAIRAPDASKAFDHELSYVAAWRSAAASPACSAATATCGPEARLRRRRRRQGPRLRH